MKIKKNLIGLCLVGVTLISNVSVYGATKSRVPEKPMYTGVMDVYAKSCVDAGYWCHNFECPVVGQKNIPDYFITNDNKYIGDNPSYMKNTNGIDVYDVIVNNMPFTLPVGKVMLSDILSVDLNDDIEMNIKEGVNKYTITIDGKTLTTNNILGVQKGYSPSGLKDLNKKHWAYSSIVKALNEGWIKPDSSSVFGMETYGIEQSPINGKKYKVRTDVISHEELFRGINGVLMSNGIYLGDRFSRVDISTLLKYLEGFGSDESINKLVNLEGNYYKYADWLSVFSNSSAIPFEEYSTISIYRSISDIYKKDTMDINRDTISRIIHNIVYDMGLPVVNNMSGNEYSYYDKVVIEDNLVKDIGYRTGSVQYCISRGIIGAEKVNGKYREFSSGVVGKPEFATILCNLDRAIKASKSK